MTHEPERFAVVGSAIGVGALLVGVGFALDRVTMNVVTGVLVVLVLFLMSVPLLQRITRVDGEPGLTQVFLWGLAAKFVFTLVRYFVINVVYGGNGDAGVYSEGGAFLAPLYRVGTFGAVPPILSGRGVETERIAMVVGAIYSIIGVSDYAAFFIFAWVCFMGQVLMWRAFKRAVPEGDHRRYAILVLFLPSMLFWPSSIGKEAIMLGCIGMVCFGAAQILGERVRLAGVMTFLAGVAGLSFIRPHMALIAIVSLGFASAVGTLAGFRSAASPRVFVIRMVALTVLVISASVATTQMSRFFSEDDSADEGGVSSVLDRTTEQTSQGGSEFAAPAVSNPVELPAGVVTVLFRPFPWEARNVNGLIASAEGILLLALFFAGHRRLITWFKTAPKRPYLVFAIAYAMVFIITFSYIGNFGILARQRTQMLPLALTMIAMYPAVRNRPSVLGGRRGPPQPLSAANPVDETAGATTSGRSA